MSDSQKEEVMLFETLTKDRLDPVGQLGWEHIL